MNTYQNSGGCTLKLIKKIGKNFKVVTFGVTECYSVCIV